MLTCGKTLFTPCSAEMSASMIWVAMLTLMGMTKLGSQPCAVGGDDHPVIGVVADEPARVLRGLDALLDGGLLVVARDPAEEAVGKGGHARGEGDLGDQRLADARRAWVEGSVARFHDLAVGLDAVVDDGVAVESRPCPS